MKSAEATPSIAAAAPGTMNVMRQPNASVSTPVVTAPLANPMFHTPLMAWTRPLPSASCAAAAAR
jgi:hypothetical protein